MSGDDTAALFMTGGSQAVRDALAPLPDDFVLPQELPPTPHRDAALQGLIEEADPQGPS